MAKKERKKESDKMKKLLVIDIIFRSQMVIHKIWR